MSTLVFFDEAGGGLALLAASMAAARGLPARALTASARPVAPEINQVLAEIGVACAGSANVSPAPNGAITIGPGPNHGIVAKLYDGPDPTAFGPAELERHATARIARDRIERWLDRTHPR